MLTTSLAQEIARETSEIIGFNVVITDREGIVIADGAHDRVGALHEASIEVVRTGEAAEHDAAHAHRLSGVRPGVTLPVVLDGDVVGTVGITGAPSRVRRFGLLVRHHTEILLRESSLIASKLVRDKAITDLLRDIAHHDPAVIERDVVEFGARELGFDLRLPRAAVVVEMDQVPASRRGSVERTAGAVFRDREDIVGTLGQSRLVAFHRTSRADSSELCRSLLKAVDERHEVALRIGIGGVADSVGGLQASYQDAVAAARLRSRNTIRAGWDPRIAHIADYRMHHLLAATDTGTRRRFAEAVLGDLRRQGDWGVLRETVLAWCEHGFHLVRASEALHVHRNTLLYRLRKIESITGVSSRDHRFTLALYVGCLLDEVGIPPA
ncbi:sugar diacid recognition domain-containing protein [Saccharopolyspora shandongensis]|uniref:CdaR family transcriptional regulator n=1 Tax=Saccharopolyspora shandongensis TaxID=418495 RepID=UPI0033E2B261